MIFDVKKLYCLMAKKGFTAKSLTKAAGVGANTVRGIIKHGQKPSPATIGKLALALNVEPEELLKEE